MESRTFAVNGMSCHGCEANVTGALEGLAGVDAAEADHEGDHVTVVRDPARVTDDDIVAAIEDAGYRVPG